MFKIRRLLCVSLFVFSLAALSAPVSKAQQISNYLFLEVIDSNAKPVAEATVEVTHPNRTVQTDENGAARSRLPSTRSDFTASLFKVSKPGYFPFQDLGTPMEHSEQLKTKVELLKIPQTIEERRLLGNEQLKREFLWAAKIGDAPTIRRLLKSGISPNLKTDDLRGVSASPNIPAILFAAASGDPETIKILLKAGAKINQADARMREILVYYLRSNLFYSPLSKKPPTGKQETREFDSGAISLIKAGARIDNLQNYGVTALMLAAQRGSPGIVKYLLSKKSSVNAADKGGATALMYSLYTISETNPPQTEVIDLLLNAGARINAQNNGAENVLVSVMRSAGTESLKKLVARGLLTLNEPIYAGMTAMMYVLERLEHRGALVAEAIKILLAAGADPNVSVVGYNGAASRKTALMLAAFKGNLEAMRALIARGADVNFDLGDGDSALAVAARGGGDKIASVKLLIEAGADVKGRSGSLALKAAKMFSGRKADQDLIELLIKAGAK